jgi:hypothetical protein
MRANQSSAPLGAHRGMILLGCRLLEHTLFHVVVLPLSSQPCSLKDAALQ